MSFLGSALEMGRRAESFRRSSELSCCSTTLRMAGWGGLNISEHGMAEVSWTQHSGPGHTGVIMLHHHRLFWWSLLKPRPLGLDKQQILDGLKLSVKGNNEDSTQYCALFMMFIFLITFDTLTVKHVIIEQQQSNWQTLMAFGIMRVASPPPLSRPDSPVRLDYKCLGGGGDSETQTLLWWTASSSSNQRKRPNPAAQRMNLKVRLALSLSLDVPVAAVGLFLEIMFRTSQRVQELLKHA